MGRQLTHMIPKDPRHLIIQWDGQGKKRSVTLLCRGGVCPEFWGVNRTWLKGIVYLLTAVLGTAGKIKTQIPFIYSPGCQEMSVSTDLVGDRVQLLELCRLGLEKVPSFLLKKFKNSSKPSVGGKKAQWVPRAIDKPPSCNSHRFLGPPQSMGLKYNWPNIMGLRSPISQVSFQLVYMLCF